MQKSKSKLKIAIIGIILAFPQITGANSLIVSTVKTPDPYSGNQSWFRYYQSPGSTVDDSIILRNAGNQNESIKLYATDATANEAGSFSPKMANEEQKGIGAWTTLEKSEVTLGPNESVEVKFKINIPQDIAPGQYFGSIINEEVSADIPCDEILEVSTKCQGNIQIRTRTGNRIYLTIPGEIKQDIKLNSFNWKKSEKNSVHFNFSFTNNGNVAFQPKAYIRIYDAWGKQITTLEGKLGKSLPGTTISPVIDWKLRGEFGNFTAKAEIYYQEDDQGRFDNLHGTVLSERAELKIFIFPWGAFITILGLLLIIVGTWYIRLAYYQNMINSCEDYSVKEGENILEIAEKFGVKWKTIACINKLKAPYSLETKQKLKIPSDKHRKHGK